MFDKNETIAQIDVESQQLRRRIAELEAAAAAAPERAQETLRRYEFIVNAVTDMMSVINTQGRYEAVNDAWCKATGKNRSLVLDKPLAEVWPEDEITSGIWPRLEQCFAGETVQYQATINFPGYGQRHCEVIMYPFGNDQEGITHAVVVTRDITERKRAEEELAAHREHLEELVEARTAELRASEALFRALTEQTGEGISLAGADGNYTFVNPAFCRLTGFSEEELLQMSVFDLAPPGAKPSVFPKALQHESTTREFQMLKKDGSPYVAEILGYPVEVQGKLCVLGIFRDITERKQVEKDREKLIFDLQKALAEIKTLRGIVPICSYCKRIRDDHGYWEQVESYVQKHSEADFSHSICPDCMKEKFPGISTTPE